MISFKQFLSEARNDEVIHNPSIDRIKAITAGSKYKVSKFVLFKDGSHSVADANNHTHTDISMDHGKWLHWGTIRHHPEDDTYHYFINNLHPSKDPRPKHKFFDRLESRGFNYTGDNKSNCIKTANEDILTETVRNQERANKLAKYISKRHSKKADFIRPDSEFDNNDRDVIWRAVEKHCYRNNIQTRNGNIDDMLHKEYKTAKETQFPIHKIITTQSTVETPGVIDKINNTDSDPIKLIRHKGLHYLINGHHRYFAAKIKGDTHIPAKVVTIR